MPELCFARHQLLDHKVYRDDFESALQYAIYWRFGECISKEMASSRSMDHIHEIVQYVRCSIVPLCLRK